MPAWVARIDGWTADVQVAATYEDVRAVVMHYLGQLERRGLSPDRLRVTLWTSEDADQSP